MVVLTEISQESSSACVDHDVFLSFRGTDTRYKFTDHLYKALKDAGIKTFLDEAEIQTGEELKPELVSAIKGSRASIIVLSKNYASSTWCLDELVLILEQSMTSQHIVFPIFYDIEPTDVRKQQSSFGEAMAKHKQKMTVKLAGKIEKWEKALTQVANIKGKETYGRRETEIIEEIVKEMSNRLGLPKRSNIPRLIGREDSISTIMSFLKKHSTGVLTIWGMAGIGKTCLADYIFKSQQLDFEGRSFLQDIERKCEEQHGLLDLQKQLLQDIRDGRWMDIQNTDVGTFKIQELLPRKRTLLVLDGINKVEQLDALIGTKGLRPGSKIIITSKNGSLTEKCGLFKTQIPPEHAKHRLWGLGLKESVELLNWHAYGHNDPKEGDEQESRKVVEYCRGHPLALKVLGSCFCNGDDTTWEDILEPLRKKMNPDIKKVLQISFDSLPLEQDRELFKHIACFFVGQDIDFAEKVLKGCGICRSSGIKSLINRCLLTKGSPNKLMMHQLLQDMGRDIVRQESPKPWKRSLLWDHEECLDVLQKSKGTKKIEGLVFDIETSCTSSNASNQKFGDDPNDNFRSFPLLHWVRLLLSVIWRLFGWVAGLFSSLHRQEGGFETHAFREMRNLRILRLNYVQLNGSYENFPGGIRWLCMHGFPLSYIPSGLQMENMVALDMSNSKLRLLWKKQPKSLKSMKFLNLSGCRELVTVRHFSELPLLETLMLAGCTSLVEVCESIGNCAELVLLDMSDCNKIKGLPKSIGKLKKLQTFLLTGCSRLSEFPVEIEANNINIGSLVARRISKSLVISLPSSLVSLSLINCNLATESFPMNFSSLSMLKNLSLDGNPIISLPDCVRSLVNLEFLSVRKCHTLKTALCVPRTLFTFYALSCESLDKITFYPDPETIAHLGHCLLDQNALTEVHWTLFKVEAIAEVDEGMLHSLGWINVQDMIIRYKGEIRRAKMHFQDGIFTTCFQGEELPNWIIHKSSGSSISITIPSSPKSTYRIRGLNICIVRTHPHTKNTFYVTMLLRNLTKNWGWSHNPKMFIDPEGSKGVVWLSHWTFRNNEFEDGDEVSVHFKYLYTNHTINFKECGISLVYDDGNKNEDPLACYKATYHEPSRTRSTLDPKVPQELQYDQFEIEDLSELELEED